MNEQQLKELAQMPEARPKITLKHHRNALFRLLANGDTLTSQRGKPRLFKLTFAHRYLEGIGIEDFDVRH